MSNSFFTFRRDISFLLRIWLGFMMVWHTHKIVFAGGMREYVAYVDKLGIPFPELLGYLSKYFEFFGGVMVLLGLCTRIGAAMIAIVLAVATFWVNRHNIIGNGELALNYLIISLVIFCSPPATFGLGKLIGKKAS